MEFSNVEVRIFLKEEELENEELYKNKIFSLFNIKNVELFKVESFDSASKEDKSFYKMHSNSLEHFKFKKFNFFRSVSKGFENKKIVFLNFVDRNKDNVKSVFEKIVKGLSDGDFKSLILTSDSRIDDNNKFYLRLDKNSFLEGSFVLSDSGSVVHFSFHILTYPKSKVEALKQVISFIREVRSR